MKVELHLHTTRYSGCAAATPHELMGRLIEAGYEAVYITEHRAVWGDGELGRLREEFPQIRIFPGVELTLDVPGSLDLLVLGTNDPLYLTLHDETDVLEKARAEEHLTILAHPFRWGDAGGLLKMGLLPDALEYRTPNHDGGPAREAEVAAEELGLPLVNAGDVHALSFIDRFWIDTSAPIGNPRDIRQIILDGAYENRARDKK